MRKKVKIYVIKWKQDKEYILTMKEIYRRYLE